MIHAAGFEVIAKSRPYIVEFNVHPKPPLTPFHLARRAVLRAVAGSGRPGVLHRALLARPRV